MEMLAPKRRKDKKRRTVAEERNTEKRGIINGTKTFPSMSTWNDCHMTLTIDLHMKAKLSDHSHWEGSMRKLEKTLSLSLSLCVRVCVCVCAWQTDRQTDRQTQKDRLADTGSSYLLKEKSQIVWERRRNERRTDKNTKKKRSPLQSQQHTQNQRNEEECIESIDQKKRVLERVKKVFYLMYLTKRDRNRSESKLITLQRTVRNRSMRGRPVHWGYCFQ